MSYVIVETKDKNEMKFLRELMKKMKLNFYTEEEEDKALLKAMKEVDFSKTVSKQKLMKKLRSK